MAIYSTETVPRPGDLKDHTDGAVLYRVSNLVTRAIIGVLGVLLPIIFIVGEAFFLRGGVRVRGSISAYYHTSMRDVFVAGLCVIGFFLATYLSGEPRTRDFWLSLVAGVAVILVVFFPTMRPNLLHSAPRCGATPMPDGCSPIQQTFTEGLVASAHFVFAAIFILSLAFLCFEFARRENDRKGSAKWARAVRACGWIIFAALGLVVLLAVPPSSAHSALREVAAAWALLPLAHEGQGPPACVRLLPASGSRAARPAAKGIHRLSDVVLPHHLARRWAAASRRVVPRRRRWSRAVWRRPAPVVRTAWPGPSGADQHDQLLGPGDGRVEQVALEHHPRAGGDRDHHAGYSLPWERWMVTA